MFYIPPSCSVFKTRCAVYTHRTSHFGPGTFLSSLHLRVARIGQYNSDSLPGRWGLNAHSAGREAQPARGRSWAPGARVSLGGVTGWAESGGQVQAPQLSRQRRSQCPQGPWITLLLPGSDARLIPQIFLVSVPGFPPPPHSSRSPALEGNPGDSLRRPQSTAGQSLSHQPRQANSPRCHSLNLHGSQFPHL